MILKVENGCFSYKNADRQILKDISFTLKPGDMAAILGPNGAGKTTLLRCIMGFLKWNSGQSFLNDRPIASMPARELWKSIAYVPQARGTVSTGTALETVLIGRGASIGLFSKPSQTDLLAAEQAMERLNILHLAEKRCSEISGGELQMVLIARAIAANPKVLILDEPESNLDFKNQLIVLGAMSALAQDGITCLFNTHYPAHALQRANKALLLTREGTHLFGDAHSVVTEENIRAAFGVKAVIGEVETPQQVLRDVIPIALDQSGGPVTRKEISDTPCIAALSILTREFAAADRINEILHEYAAHLIGRMGLPYRKAGVNIITVTIDAPKHIIESLSAHLAVLPGVSVKTTYAQETGETI